MWASVLTRANAEQNKTYYGHVCNTGTYRAIILLLTTKYEIKKMLYTHVILSLAKMTRQLNT